MLRSLGARNAKEDSRICAHSSGVTNSPCLCASYPPGAEPGAADQFKLLDKALDERLARSRVAAEAQVALQVGDNSLRRLPAAGGLAPALRGRRGDRGAVGDVHHAAGGSGTSMSRWR